MENRPIFWCKCFWQHHCTLPAPCDSWAQGRHSPEPPAAPSKLSKDMTCSLKISILAHQSIMKKSSNTPPLCLRFSPTDCFLPPVPVEIITSLWPGQLYPKLSHIHAKIFISKTRCILAGYNFSFFFTYQHVLSNTEGLWEINFHLKTNKGWNSLQRNPSFKDISF